MAEINPSVKWLYAAEADGGGISAWKNGGTWHVPYPEVTGYLLPTMVTWGAGDLAIRSADWLLTVQNADGSFNGIDGIARPFDTSAIIEGLCFIPDVRYWEAANRARRWVVSQISPDGYLYNSPGAHTPNIYNLRASAIVDNYQELDYWKDRKLIYNRERSHYLAYALEGALNFGDVDWAMKYIELAYHSGNRLQPFYVDHNWQPVSPDFDICASAQMAILFNRVGLDAAPHYEAIKHHIAPNGGVPQSTSDSRQISWGARYYLDLVAMMEGVTA